MRISAASGNRADCVRSLEQAYNCVAGLQRAGASDQALALVQRAEEKHVDLYWLLEGRLHLVRGDPAGAEAARFFALFSGFEGRTGFQSSAGSDLSLLRRMARTAAAAARRTSRGEIRLTRPSVSPATVHL